MPRNNRLLQGLRGRKILKSLNINNVTNLRHAIANEYQDVFGANHQGVSGGKAKVTSDDCRPSSVGQNQKDVISNVAGPNNVISIVTDSNLSDKSDLESTVSMSSVLMTTHEFVINISPLPDESDDTTTKIMNTNTVDHIDVQPYSYIRSLSLSDLTHDGSSSWLRWAEVRVRVAFTNVKRTSNALLGNLTTDYLIVTLYLHSRDRGMRRHFLQNPT